MGAGVNKNFDDGNGWVSGEVTAKVGEEWEVTFPNRIEQFTEEELLPLLEDRDADGNPLP